MSNTRIAYPICRVCGLRKKPLGRDAAAAVANSLCDHECPGYMGDPEPGSLWPGEMEVEAMTNDLSLDDVAAGHRLALAQLDELRAELASAIEQRDAAFRLSRCECDGAEACANLVRAAKDTARMDWICKRVLALELCDRDIYLDDETRGVIDAAMAREGEA